MGIVIQIVPGKAEVRPSYWTYPGAADNAARDDLGAILAVGIHGTRPVVTGMIIPGGGT
ncbi:hypothetical protein [Pseudonocardia adelaidensis]|uniref:Uncharacterized protein n=1 Tax=Pseudonocardia adelaidensis TaxID=648754 RepID=A0ABP9P1D2_9PSEU